MVHGQLLRRVPYHSLHLCCRPLLATRRGNPTRIEPGSSASVLIPAACKRLGVRQVLFPEPWKPVYLSASAKAAYRAGIGPAGEWAARFPACGPTERVGPCPQRPSMSAAHGENNRTPGYSEPSAPCGSRWRLQGRSRPTIEIREPGIRLVPPGSQSRRRA
jgi:hypothetical protein